MRGWACQVEIPLRELGRVRVPSARMRYRDGWVRLGLNRRRTRLIATLEDREGHLVAAPTQTDACAKAAVMGRIIVYHLMRFNRYEPGEPTGIPGRMQVALA